jgi:hypothetical protein
MNVYLYVLTLKATRFESSQCFKTIERHAIRLSKYTRTFIHHFVLNASIFQVQSRDSSVGIALGYGLDDRGSRVRFPAGAGNFSLHHRVKNGFEAYPASYSMGTRGSFPGGKAAGS